MSLSLLRRAFLNFVAGMICSAAIDAAPTVGQKIGSILLVATWAALFVFGRLTLAYQLWCLARQVERIGESARAWLRSLGYEVK